MSSVYHRILNSMVEFIVKSTKRLLIENIGFKGDLHNHNIVQAMYTLYTTEYYWNTPYTTAHIMYGRRLKDSLPYIKKDVMEYNTPHICSI